MAISDALPLEASSPTGHSQLWSWGLRPMMQQCIKLQHERATYGWITVI